MFDPLSFLQPLLLFAGTATLLSFSASLLGFLVAHLLPGQSLRLYGAKQGAWALVTGCTDGIGREFALQLAARGFGVLLVGRSETKLAAVAAEIESKSGGPVKYQVLDFSDPRPQDWTSLRNTLSDLSISVLVNNVGRSHAVPIPFTETSEEEIDSIISINVTNTVKLTQLVLPTLTRQKRSLILTMGSFAAEYPTPLLATYAGAKSFLKAWSKALGIELASKGVTVRLLNSYLVASKMSKIRNPSLTIPTPKDIVASTLSTIGRTDGEEFVFTPFWAHAFLHFLYQRIPETLLMNMNLKMHTRIRASALKKLEAKKAL